MNMAWIRSYLLIAASSFACKPHDYWDDDSMHRHVSAECRTQWSKFGKAQPIFLGLRLTGGLPDDLWTSDNRTFPEIMHRSASLSSRDSQLQKRDQSFKSSSRDVGHPSAASLRKPTVERRTPRSRRQSLQLSSQTDYAADIRVGSRHYGKSVAEHSVPQPLEPEPSEPELAEVDASLRQLQARPQIHLSSFSHTHTLC